MATHMDAPLSIRGERAAQANWWLVVTATVLAVTVVALGAWIIYDQTQSGSVPAEVADVIDEYNAAMNTADISRAEAIMTDDYRYAVNDGAVLTRDDQMARFAFLDLSGYETERIGDLVVVGDGPYYATDLRQITAPGLLPGSVDVIMVYTIVDDDGVLKVSRHLIIGDY